MDHVLHQGAVRLEHLHGGVHTVQRAGADDADQQSHEQGRHTHGADLLDAAADAAENDKHSQHHEDQAIDNGLGGAGHESAEHRVAQRGAGRVRRRGGDGTGAKARAEQVAYIEHHILNAVAAQSAVEEQDEERGQDAHPAHPAELLAKGLICCHSALACLTTNGQLAHHDDESAANSQNEVNDEEREAAAGAHLIGEAPDVAQADRRADRGHQESEIGSKAFSFFHCFLSLQVSPAAPRRACLYLTAKKPPCKIRQAYLNTVTAEMRFFFIRTL